MSPIKIVKNPDGSLQRAALTQAALAKERRDLRDAQKSQELDSVTKDLNKPWLDPMPAAGDRSFAAVCFLLLLFPARNERNEINRVCFFSFFFQDFRGAAPPNEVVPEWKKATQGKNVMYGRVTSMTIKEQRYVFTFLYALFLFLFFN